MAIILVGSTKSLKESFVSAPASTFKMASSSLSPTIFKNQSRFGDGQLFSFYFINISTNNKKESNWKYVYLTWSMLEAWGENENILLLREKEGDHGRKSFSVLEASSYYITKELKIL